MTVTAYTLNECGKPPGHPAYGITKSGNYVREEWTIAAGPELPFGTLVYIPDMKKIYRVEDRGSKVSRGRLDIYMKDRREALQFGKQKLRVIYYKGERKWPQ